MTSEDILNFQRVDADTITGGQPTEADLRAVAAEGPKLKAIAFVRKSPPAVIVADFFHQADFRDRLSNLESLLATAQASPATKIMVFYEPAHQAVLDKVAARLRIDAALTMPVDEAALRETLLAWHG